MASQFEQLRTQFNGLDIIQKKNFIQNLQKKLQDSSNNEYKRFLNECITTYKKEVQLNLELNTVNSNTPIKKGNIASPTTVKTISNNVRSNASMPSPVTQRGAGIDSQDKPIDTLALRLSIVSIVALILGIIPINWPDNILGWIILLSINVGLVALPIIALIISNKRKLTHNTKVPKIISIVVLVIFGIINILAFMQSFMMAL